MKKVFMILVFITISLITYAQSDTRYDSGLNLPFNEKAGDVNPQTGNITLSVKGGSVK